MKQAVQEIRAGNHDQAVDLTTEIIEREADHAGAHAIQFSALFKAQRLEQARRMGTVAAKLNPKSIFVLNNQACLQLEAKQPAAAAGLLKSLIDQYGERGQWLYNLALAQRMVGNFDYAINTFSRTLDFDEVHDRAAFQLADCHTLAGNREQALRAFDYVRLLRGKHAPSHSNYLHYAVSNNQISEQDFKLELAVWQDRFIPSENCYETSPITDSSAVNFGFLIGKLPDHWLTTMVAPLINGLSNASNSNANNDTVSVYWHDEQLSPLLFDDTVNVVQSAQFTDADFARQVRSDSIQVLIDVCGMRTGCRQRVLGLQVAAKQYGWLAHEGHYASKHIDVLHLPYAMDFNNAPKSIDTLPENAFYALGVHRGLSERVISAWADILNELPDWNLHIPSRNELINKHLRHRFEALKVDRSRLLFGDPMQLSHTSIALDNFIENDPVASMMALSNFANVSHSQNNQGLNQGGIVTLKGEHYPAQHTARLLDQCGCNDQISVSLTDYKQQAINLARQNSGLQNSESESANPENSNLESSNLEKAHQASADQTLDAMQIRNINAFIETFRAAVI